MPTASLIEKWLPRELVDVSTTGGAFTVAGYLLMVATLVMQCVSFMTDSYATNVALDAHGTDNLQINWDVSYPDIECRNVAIKVFAQGTEEPIERAFKKMVLQPLDPKGRPHGFPIDRADFHDRHEHECPTGYEQNIGDIPGTDQFGRGDENHMPSVQDCANDCNSRPECNSFEYSTERGNCFLNKESQPTDAQYEDYLFCTKVAKGSEHDKEKDQVRKQDGEKEIDADWSSSHDGFKHANFEHVLQGHDFTLINFFAGWCSHCQQFAPRWDQIATKVNGDDSHPPMQFPDRDGTMRAVRLLKMNCVDFKDLCMKKGIDAYPTIRLYKADGTFSLFEGKRDEPTIIMWIERAVHMKSYGFATHHDVFERGCNTKGALIVPRVPGHLLVWAGGGDQNLNPSMTNVSMVIKHFSFTEVHSDPSFQRKTARGLPKKVVQYLSPLDGKDFLNHKLHEAWNHHIKVVSTISTRGEVLYQFSTQHQLTQVNTTEVPQVKFYYDIEPFSIQISKENKKWYDFFTITLAILGGTFAVMRLMSKVSLATVTILRDKLERMNGGSRRGYLDEGYVS